MTINWTLAVCLLLTYEVSGIHGCEWGQWGGWGACTEPCGGGMRTRVRVATVGEECDRTKDYQAEECNTQTCEERVISLENKKMISSINDKLGTMTSSIDSKLGDMTASIEGRLGTTVRIEKVLEGIQQGIELQANRTTRIEDQLSEIQSILQKVRNWQQFGHPDYYPEGPQTNVALSTVLSGGWSKCYSETYDKKMLGRTFERIRDRHCTGTKVTDTAHLQNKGRVSHGTRWYVLDRGESKTGSWGFAGQQDEINLFTVDTIPGEQRLSWYLNADGWRCGSTKSLSGNRTWEKMVFTTMDD